jgi:hypothetical protein
MRSSHDQVHLNTGWFQCGESLAATGPFWKDRFCPQMTRSPQVRPYSELYCEVDQPFQPQKLERKLRNILPRTRFQQQQESEEKNSQIWSTGTDPRLL